MATEIDVRSQRKRGNLRSSRIVCRSPDHRRVADFVAGVCAENLIRVGGVRELAILAA
jgi:hypothetical protein